MTNPYESIPTLSVTEVMKRLRVAKPTVHRWCRNASFGVMVGKRYRIPEQNVIDLEQKLLRSVVQSRGSKR